MPAKSKKSSLASKVKAASVKKHAGDETRTGNVNLPGGIKGVAKLKTAYFEVYKSGDYQGEYYFRASGTILSPEKVFDTKLKKDVKVKGLSTQIMIPCCDTKTRAGKETTQEQHIDRIMNEMRKLGASTDAVEDGGDLETLAEAIAEAKPEFKFNTSWRNPDDEDDDGIWENWNGEVASSDEEDDDEVEEDDDDEEEDEDDSDSDEEEEEDESEDDEEDESSEGVDIKALRKAGKIADDEDEGEEEAQAQIKEAAEAVGVSLDDIEEADSWDDAVTLIEEASKSRSDDDEEDDEDEEDSEPEKGDVYNFKPPKKKKEIEVEVTRVNLKAKTVNARSVADGTLHKSIPWDALQS